MKETMREVDITQFKKVISDIAYAQNNPSQRMDLILPDEGDTPVPVVVWLHGGGWIKGSRRQATANGDFLGSVFKAVSQGYAVAAVGYSFLPYHPWPQQIYDVKAAVRYLKKHSGTLGIDPNRMVVWGESAGAHLAQILAATAHCDELEDPNRTDKQISCEVNGLVSLFGLSDLSKIDEQFDQISNEIVPFCVPGSAPCEFLIGGPIMENQAKAAAASCMQYVDHTFPAALLQHGKQDQLVPYLQSVALYNKICACCGSERATLHLFEDDGHATIGFHTDENTNVILDFMDSICFSNGVRQQPRTVLPELVLTEEFEF